MSTRPPRPPRRRGVRRRWPSRTAPPRRPARPASVSGPPGRRPQTAPRRRRRVALSAAPAAFGLGLVVLASFAGFATGHLTGAEPAARSPAPAHVDLAAAERVADARRVDHAIRYLNAERTTARRKLHAARRAGAQAAHARALADAYRHARGLLPSQGAAAGVLAVPLTDAERGYRRLATAADATLARLRAGPRGSAAPRARARAGAPARPTDLIAYAPGRARSSTIRAAAATTAFAAAITSRPRLGARQGAVDVVAVLEELA